MPPLPSRRQLWLLHLAWMGACIAITIAAGDRNDYPMYQEQWRLILLGTDPWTSDIREINAYGPLHVLFAPLWALHWLAPKVMTVGIMLAGSTLLVGRLIAERGGDGLAVLLYAVIWPGNFVLSLYAVSFGLNDLTCAGLILGAIVARLEGRLVLAGVLIGLGGLMKFYPLVLLPFFMIGEKRLHLRVALAALAVFLGGMGAAWLAWGESVLVPIRFASGRGAGFLNIIEPIRHFGGAALHEQVQWLAERNVYFVGATAAFGGLYVWRRGYSWLSGAAIVVLPVLLVYKTGHLQFWLCWMAVVAGLLAVRTEETERMVWAALPMILWLTAFGAFLCAFGRFVQFNIWPWSIPHLLFGLISLWRMLRVEPAFARRRLSLAW